MPLPAQVVQIPWPRALGLADGLPTSDIRAVGEDATGYLWLASADGLLRFDGQRFRTLRHEDGLPDADLQGLHVDARDRIWLATGHHGVVMLGADRVTFERADAAAPAAVREGNVRKVIGTPDGRIWIIGDDQQVYVRTGEQAGWQRLPLGDDPIAHLVVDRAGRVWAASMTRLWRSDGHAFRPVPLPRVIASPLRWLWADPRGGVEIATGQRSWALDASGQLTRAPHTARSLLRGHDGVLWQQAGASLQWQQAGQVRQIGWPSGISAAEGPVQIRQLLQDRNGDLWWVSERHGLWWLSARWRQFTALPAVGEDGEASATQPVLGLIASGRHHAWMARAHGGLQRLDLRSGRVVHALSGVTPRDATAPARLAEDAQGRVWIARAGELLRYMPATRQLRRWSLGTPPFVTILALQACAQDRIWLADSESLQAWSAAGRRLWRTPVEQLGLSVVADARQLMCTRDGTLWATDPRGLMRWMPARERFELQGDAQGGATTALVEADDDTLWVARHGAVEQYRALARDVKRLRRISTADGYPQLRADALAVDAAGVLWAGAVRGLVRVDPRQGDVALFGVAHGLPAQEILPQRLVRLGSGALVAAVREGGLLAFDPAVLPLPPVVPVLVVDAMTRRRHDRMMAVPWGSEPILLGTADRNIRVAVSLLGRGDPDRTRHRFRLLGHDPVWIDTGPVAQRIFARLPAGDHVLLIQARHATGPWSAVRELRLRVVPAWWQTPAGRTALLGLLAGMVVLLGRGLRRYRLRRERHRLARSRLQLAELDSRERTRFLARLGRQIRTPMTPVLGWSELLLQSALSPAQHTQVGSLHQAGHHLLQLMDDALDLASIEASRLHPVNAPFLLHALLEELQALLQPVAQSKAISLHWTGTFDPGLHLLGDVQRLRQILLNLLGNALKFTARGQVGLDVRMGEDGHGLHLVITDTGPGMNAEQVQQLFRRFSQVEGTHSRHGGSGLGLAISRELAQAMGGDIEVHSEPGRGTRFTVQLPWRSMQRAPSDPMPARPPGGARSLRIMLLVPSASVSDVVCALLRAQGHRVLGVDDIETWLSHADPGPWDLIAADPDMLVAGERVSARLPWLWPGVGRLALSPRADACAERDALSAGFDLFLRLPVTGARLQAALARCVARR